ncbi:MAG: prolipoprotein diacylglyceryl transferase family protein [Phycisphaerales bacterium]
MRSDPPAWSVKYPTEITEVWAKNTTEFEASLQSLEPLRTTISGGNSFYQSVVQEMYAGNNQVISFVQPQLTAWYPSQLFQALAEGPLLFCVLLAIWWRPRNPGVIASSFLLFYGVGRIVTEVFRQPDEGVAIIAGLSRGQLLSVSMVVTGTALVLLSTKLNTTKLNTTKLGGFKNTL